MTVSLPATQARNSFFELLDAARFMGQVTEILKNGKVVAKIVPPEITEMDWLAHLAELKKSGPFLTKQDVLDMKKTRNSFNKPRDPSW